MNDLDGAGAYIDGEGHEQLVWNVRIDDVMVKTSVVDIMDRTHV